jgi:hypothetical protein
MCCPNFARSPQSHENPIEKQQSATGLVGSAKQQKKPLQLSEVYQNLSILQVPVHIVEQQSLLRGNARVLPEQRKIWVYLSRCSLLGCPARKKRDPVFIRAEIMVGLTNASG